MKTLFLKAGAFFLTLGAAAMLMTSCQDKTPGTSDDVDKNALIEIITECDALLADSEGNYPQQSIEALTKILNDAKAIRDNENSTQAQINQIAQNLTTAKNKFIASRYEDIAESSILAFFDFNTAPVENVISSTGTKPLAATLSTGPVEIFGEDAVLPTFSAGIDGNAINFTKGSHLAINEYTPTSYLLNTMSWAFWVKTTDASRPGNYVISLNYWNNWKINIQENGKPMFTVKTTSATVDMDNESDQTAQNDTWVHLAFTMDLTKSTITFYVNGEVSKVWTTETKPDLKGTIAPAYESPLGEQLPLLIGAATTYAEAEAVWTWGEDWKTPEKWDCLEGAIDNLGIYNTTLSAGQVARMYQDQKPN